MADNPDLEIRKPEPVGPEAYWTAVGIYIFIIVILLFLAAFLIGFMIEPFKAEINLALGVPWYVLYAVAALIGLGVYVLASFETQLPDEWGIKLLFGSRVIQVVDNGPTHVLKPLATLEKLPKDTFQNQYPDEDHKIDWERNAGDPPAQGKVAPIRSTTKAGDGNSSDPLERRMTINWSAAVTLQILDPLQFSIVMGMGKEGRDNARKQIEDAAVSVVSAEIGQHTAAWIIANISKLNTLLEQASSIVVRGNKPVLKDGEVVEEVHPSSAWGVRVVSAILVRYDLPQTVNEAMRSIPAALFAKEKTVTDAEATKIKKEREGAGEATARRLLEEAILKGMAAGVAAMKDTGLNAEQAIAANVAKAIADSESNTTYLGESAIANAAKAIASSLGK